MGDTVRATISPENAAEAVAFAREAVDGPKPPEEEPVPSPDEAAQTTDDNAEATPAPEQQQEGLDIPKPAEETEEAEEAPTENPVDLDAIQTYYAEHGELSDEMRTELVDALASRFGDRAEGMVDTYFAGLSAQTAVAESAAHAITGGADNYSAMVQWAAAELSEAEQAAYNRGVNDPALRELTVQGLHAKWQAAGGASSTNQNPPPRPSDGQTPARSGVEPFRSYVDVAKFYRENPDTDTNAAKQSELLARIEAGERAGFLK